MSEPMIFSQAIDGLVRALKPKLTEAAKDELKALGLDLRKSFEPAYPLAVWMKLIRFGGTLVAPQRPEREQLEELGRLFIDGYEETMLGQALLATMRLLGPRRGLERMSRNFRTGNNYTETRLEAKSEREYELWLSAVRAPEYYRGMLLAGVGRTNVKNLSVQVLKHDAEGATFGVKWDA
jgi:uncharacterized protein (TIGR02265 family)